MRILFVHNRYGAVSGEELMTELIIDVLRRNGHEVETFYRDSAEIQCQPFGQTRAFFKGIYSFEARRAVRQTLRRFQPDLVQVQNLYPLFSPSILAEIRAAAIPVVMRLANYRLVCPNGLLLSRGEICTRCCGGHEWWCAWRNCENRRLKSVGYALRNLVARKGRLYRDNVTLYYAQTHFQRAFLIGEGFPAERIDVIPNMVNRSEEVIPSGVGDFVAFAGRLSPEKGVPTFLAAARQCGDLPFAMAGSIGRMEDVARQVPENVRLHGHLERDELRRFYRDMCMLVVPSLWYEGFPGVIIEAMLQGRPVICSNLGGLPEIVDDGKTGLLFRAGDADDLAEKIRRLWNDPELCLRLGRAGRRKVLDEYSPDKYYERLMDLYRKAMVLAGKSPGHA